MSTLRKKLYVAAGYNTIFFGAGRNDFDPSTPMKSFDAYLREAADGVLAQSQTQEFDEGILGSFMPGRFLKQANLPGFLPFMVPSLNAKPCTGVEGACGTGGRTLAMAVRSILADMADKVFAAGFEVQNTMKAIYGADVLAGAAFYAKERKKGHAFFFPGIFAERACAYYAKYGEENTRKGMAKWYEQSILNARKNSKAQEYQNKTPDLLALGMTPPDPKRFVPYLNIYDCSKVSDGASALLVLSEEGLKQCGMSKQEAVEIVGMGEAVADITQEPADLTVLNNMQIAVQKALTQAGLTIKDIGVLEVHDCFSITGLLSIEAMGLVKPGQSSDFVQAGNTAADGLIPTNLSGGLGGFGHPTGASGVRQMVDLLHQLTGKAENQVHPRTPYGMMISMGGNDKTVTCFIVKQNQL